MNGESTHTYTMGYRPLVSYGEFNLMQLVRRLIYRLWPMALDFQLKILIVDIFIEETK